MPTVTEGRYPEGFLQSAAQNTFSRDTIVVLAGQNLRPGQILGRITASNKWVALNPAASDGSQVAAGISRGHVDATGGDRRAAAFTRQCEVNAAELDYAALTAPQIAAAAAQLAAIGILLR